MSTVVGIDVGGSKLAAGRLVGATLTPATVVPTELSSSEALLNQIVRICKTLVSDDTVAVGVGVPSVVEFATGLARSSVNIPLAGVPLRQVLCERLGLSVYVDNDANCAALAEAYEGDRLAITDLVMFTVGTGVGGGLVLEGKVYRGATGGAGELGQTLIASDIALQAGSQERFPQPGSLEELASGRALDRLARQHATRHPESQLGRLRAGGATVGARDTVACARSGDPDCHALVRRVGERLGVAVANAINTFDPDVVAIGGGLAEAGELLLEPITDIARRFVLPGVGTATEIRLSRFGGEGGLLGAALLAAHEHALSRDPSRQSDRLSG